MKNPTALLFAIEPPTPKPVLLARTEEIEEALASLLLQALEVDGEQEVNEDES